MQIITTKKILSFFLLVLNGLLLLACEQPTANVSSLGRPLPTAVPEQTPTPSLTPTPKIDPRRTDLKRIVVGSTAPDFALEDLDKKLVHLSDFRGKKNVLLIFYRGYF